MYDHGLGVEGCEKNSWTFYIHIYMYFYIFIFGPRGMNGEVTYIRQERKRRGIITRAMMRVVEEERSLQAGAEQKKGGQAGDEMGRRRDIVLGIQW